MTSPAVSSGPMGVRRCISIGPASMREASSIVVTPVSASPLMIARFTGAAPR